MAIFSSLPLARRISFPGRQQAVLEEFSLPELAGDKVLVRTELSLMSTGTENIVFNRHFDAGTHWDKWVKYPFFPGYSAIGVVEAVGAEVTTVALGDRVACRFAHQSHGVVSEEGCVPVPEGVSAEEAGWFALAKIAFHGARAADYKLGDSVLVIGAGPIGQMSVRWARASGAGSITVVDTLPARLGAARAGGANATISVPLAEARDLILEANRGQLPRVVIDSTGHAAVFASALTLAARFGTVVVLGDTGSPAQQNLTGDVVLRGVRIVGAHDSHNTPEWNSESISRLFFHLAASGRFPLRDLISHRFAPGDCLQAYEVANRDRAQTMGIVFAWDK